MLKAGVRSFKSPSHEVRENGRNDSFLVGLFKVFFFRNRFNFNDLLQKKVDDMSGGFESSTSVDDVIKDLVARRKFDSFCRKVGRLAVGKFPFLADSVSGSGFEAESLTNDLNHSGWILKDKFAESY